jgi:hypothetical protein
MRIGEILKLRFDFEELTDGFQMPEGTEGSDINTLEWFVENGHRSNSLRNGFNDAYVIAQTIITEYHNGGIKIREEICNH